MYRCHKYGFKLSTTEFNRVFRTASVVPAARKPFKIVCFPSSVFKNWYTLHTLELKICLKIYVRKLTSYDITPNKINAREN